jgi:predicted TIM-barrel fold metal-dependent hydrolase
MPVGDKDWLALTPETPLEPEIPICDPHHHLWEFRPEPVAYQRYLLPDLAEDLHSGHHVRATVFIEVKARYRADGPEEMRPVGEVEFVDGLATESASGKYGRTQVAAAIIGYADLKLGERVAPVLDAMQAASPARFRGIRHSVGWDSSSELVNRDIEGVLSSDQYRAGARVLAGRGLCLENSLYHPQLAELATFARAIPELTIIVNHIGGLVRVGPYAHRDDEALPVNALLIILFLSDTFGGRHHDKRIADATPYPLPAGSRLLQDLGFLAFTLPQVEILMPTKQPRGQELTLEQQLANQALHSRRLRIEHVNSSVKRCRIVKDRIRLWKEDVRDLVMEICCTLHNFRVRLTPWQPMV